MKLLESIKGWNSRAGSLAGRKAGSFRLHVRLRNTNVQLNFSSILIFHEGSLALLFLKEGFQQLLAFPHLLHHGIPKSFVTTVTPNIFFFLGIMQQVRQIYRQKSVSPQPPFWSERQQSPKKDVEVALHPISMSQATGRVTNRHDKGPSPRLCQCPSTGAIPNRDSGHHLHFYKNIRNKKRRIPMNTLFLSIQVINIIEGL